LSEDSRKYGSENTCTSGSTLSRAALNYAHARAQMEKERGNLLKALGTQVSTPKYICARAHTRHRVIWPSLGPSLTAILTTVMLNYHCVDGCCLCSSLACGLFLIQASPC